MVTFSITPTSYIYWKLCMSTPTMVFNKNYDLASHIYLIRFWEGVDYPRKLVFARKSKVLFVNIDRTNYYILLPCHLIIVYIFLWCIGQDILYFFDSVEVRSQLCVRKVMSWVSLVNGYWWRWLPVRGWLAGMCVCKCVWECRARDTVTLMCIVFTVSENADSMFAYYSMVHVYKMFCLSSIIW